YAGGPRATLSPPLHGGPSPRYSGEVQGAQHLSSDLFGRARDVEGLAWLVRREVLERRELRVEQRCRHEWPPRRAIRCCSSSLSPVRCTKNVPPLPRRSTSR